MAKKLEVTLKDGNFVSASGEVTTFAQDKVVGNGWLLRKKDGEIEALCFQQYKDGTHSVRMLIDKECNMKVTLRTPKEGGGFKTELKKSSRLSSKEGLNGILGLSSGYLDERYVYFRENNFNNFLTKHKFTEYKFKDPNITYTLRDEEGGICTRLFTNGEVEIVDTERSEEKLANVTCATWVIFYQAKSGDKKEVVRKLITTESYKKIVLPKVLFENTAEEYIKNLRRFFNTYEDVKFYLRKFDFVCSTEHTEDIDNKSIGSDLEEFYVKYTLKDNILFIKVYRNYYWNSGQSLLEKGINMPVNYDVKRGRYSKGFPVLEAQVGICYI